jgi:predicted TIM-barrel fold metal-dependent hydrolase
MRLLNTLCSTAAICLAMLPFASDAQTSVSSAPIIDVHFHAYTAGEMGPAPQAMCTPLEYWPAWDPKTGGMAYAAAVAVHPPCAHPLSSPVTDADLMQKNIANLRARNVIGIASGPDKTVEAYRAAAPDHILPALGFDAASGKPTIAELREQVKRVHPTAFAEIENQYEGISVLDSRMEPYFALAEELDIPVGIHMGPGPPGAPYFLPGGTYRMKLSSLLQLEEVLVMHPKLRVYAMHAGWPFIDDAIATLYAHPQLYVDIGIIDYAFPRKEFYRYLHRLIDAGFENRIMFGSDQMVWPEALPAAIDAIQNDPDLTSQQKRDILYNNAARFLRIPH